MDESFNLENAEKKSNIFVDFITAWFYILLYAIRGVKFLLMDMWIAIYNNIKWSFDKNASGLVKEDASSDELYEKTKQTKEKKEKKYHYSKKTLEKYEKMKIELTNDLQMAGATRSKTPNVYQYIVRAPSGKIIKDTMSGFSKLDINSFLVNEGYEVYDIRTSKAINFMYQESSLGGSKMSVKDLVFWLTQLSTYLKSGITLSEAVRILSIQMSKKKTQQKIYKAIGYELSLGESFSNALAKQGNYFPPLLINMIKAAEATGTLQETLEDMANYYTEVNQTRKDMIGALTYPAIIMVFSVAVVTFIIVYVVPQFTQIYDNSGIEIKGLTKAIIVLSDFLQNNLVLVVLIIVFVMIMLYLLYKYVKGFRVPAQILFMKIPVVKDVLIYKEISIFAKTFASLLRNNVFITESMDILSKITSNEVYKAIMFKTINNIVKGEKISEAFNNHWAVPDVAYYMIVTGESTGQLADMMQKVSDYYQQMHKGIVNQLKSFIEPIMIIFLALMVALIILAVIVPMFSMYNQIM
ncbi:MAG: type II secretion system F family protein [Bacilli bacterium]|nr:type II secretion system F family protein [Bacilli bacterium]